MKVYGVNMLGTFITEPVATLPVWSSSDESREIYVEDEGKIYRGDGSAWKEIDATAYYPGVAGFVAGGHSPAISTIDKLLFSNDNVASITSKLTAAKYGAAGFNSDVAGFVAGGSTFSTIDKLLFSNDNVASITSTLTGAKDRAAGFEN